MWAGIVFAGEALEVRFRSGVDMGRVHSEGSGCFLEVICSMINFYCIWTDLCISGHCLYAVAC